MTCPHCRPPHDTDGLSGTQPQTLSVQVTPASHLPQSTGLPQLSFVDSHRPVHQPVCDTHADPPSPGGSASVGETWSAEASRISTSESDTASSAEASSFGEPSSIPQSDAHARGMLAIDMRSAATAQRRNGKQSPRIITSNSTTPSPRATRLSTSKRATFSHRSLESTDRLTPR